MTTSKRENPNAALWLEFIGGSLGLLGLGQFYAGRIGGGVVRLVAWLILTVLSVFACFNLLTAETGLAGIGVLLFLHFAIPLWSGFSLKRSITTGKGDTFWSWVIILFGVLYFFLPLYGTLEFSLRMRRGEYSLDAYQSVFSDPRFAATFSYSTILALVTIAIGVLLIVPTVYWVHLKLPGLRPVVEFLTLFPFVVPAIVLVFGYLRVYNSSSWLPMTGSEQTTDLLLAFGYLTLALPYMYRAVDTGLRAIDVRTLTEAAQNLGAGWFTIMARVILPNLRVALLSGAFLTFATVIGEFTFASLLDRPAFGPYLQLIGANRAYEPAALALISFALTWASIGLMQFFTRGAPGQNLTGGR